MTTPATAIDWWNDVEFSEKPTRVMSREEWEAVPADLRVEHNGVYYVSRAVLDRVIVTPK